MKRGAIRTISIFLSLLLMISILTLSTGTVNAGFAGRKIRVAQVNIPKFYYNDRYGSIGGYGYDYLEEIAAYTGWEYEYVPVSPEQGLEMLEKGEIDLLAPAYKTPDLLNRFDFSDQEVGLNYSVLCVSAEDTETAYNDFSVITV
jgi:ABC-type amino acid transport substrate-binding protein